MDLKVGDKVRIKSKEWFKNQGFFSSDSLVSDCYGKEATITERTVYGYSVNIGPKYICWLENCFEPMGYWSANMPKDSELKKTVTVNMPNDMEVSTEEYDGNITVKIQHKEEKVEEPKFKNGDILLLTSNCGFEYIAIFKEMDNAIIYIYTSINLANNRFVVNNGFFRDKMSSVRKADYDEQERIFKELANQKQLRWNAEELKFEKYRWHAEHGERYWHMTELGTVLSGPDYHNPYDNILYQLRNYFKTKELANKALLELKEFLKT